MSKKKRLGRGLEALLGVGKTSEDDAAAASQESDSKSKSPTGSGGIEINNPSTDVNSIDEVVGSPDTIPVPQKPENSDTGKTEPAGEEPPTILKFKSKPAPASLAGPPKVTTEATSQSASSRPNKRAELDSANTARTEDVRAPASKSGVFGATASTDKSGFESGGQTVELNVYDVDDNPFQPRREFNKSEIESLAESLKTHEQLQPILVRRVDDRYQLISGERRLRAAIHAGWSKIRAQVREADDRLVAELAIVENLQRKDLNPVEKALSFRRYIDEHGCSQEDLAGRLKIDRSTVTNLLRLLELPEVVQRAIQVGVISNGHARALLPLGEEHLQIEFCNRIQREGLSVRAIEQLVRDKIDEEDGVKRKPSSKGRTKSGQILSLESELRNALGTKVEIKASSRGRGKIVVHYLSRDEFERLREILGDSGDRTNRDAA